MPRRTAEANKAIRLAWEKEQALVREGKGTRDWTEEQQNDILDPDKGKAYDDNGRAFEGQHMKSVEKYPEYQGNPDNIQFLTKTEHLEAHQGNWQNPTNWYYDPVTKVFFEFTEDSLVPCSIIELSNPVAMTTDIIEDTYPADDNELSNKVSTLRSDTERGSPPDSSVDNSSLYMTYETVSEPKDKSKNTLKRFAERASKTARKVGAFALEHKEAIGVVVTIATAIWSVLNSSNKNDEFNIDDGSGSCASDNVNNNHDDMSDSVERATPREHEVSGHSQRYHTKNGVEIREKAPYPRGGKKE